MQCDSCGEEIPVDSIFCPECGSRQDLSRAGGFNAPNSVGLSGQEVTGGRNFGVVSGEAIRHQREMSVSDPNAVSPELMRQIIMRKPTVVRLMMNLKIRMRKKFK